MGKSFVLRDQAGSPAGYLQQGVDAVYCRIRMAGTREIALLYQDGGCCRKRLSDAAAEQKWTDIRAQVIGVLALVDGDEIAADSGADARRKWNEIVRNEQAGKRRRAEKKTESKELGGTGTEGMAEKREDAPALQSADCRRRDAGSGYEEIRTFPQRRWPPPPCWQEAVYHGGEWTEL